MSQEPPFDLELLMERCFHEKAFVRELLGIFQSQAVRELPTLMEAVRAGDVPRVAAVAHKLKGSAANVSADRLRDLCDALENSANLGTVSDLKVQSASVADEIRRCGEALRAMLGTIQ